MRRRWMLGAVAVAVLAAATAVLAQRRRDGFGGGGCGGGRTCGFERVPKDRNAPYDGRLTFVRMNYQSTPDGCWYGGQPAWAHGYPTAEQNLVQIMNEVSYLNANTEGFNTLRF